MTTTAPTTATRAGLARQGLRAPVARGVAVGVLQAVSPLAVSRLDTATVCALGLILIAAALIAVATTTGFPSPT